MQNENFTVDHPQLTMSELSMETNHTIILSLHNCIINITMSILNRFISTKTELFKTLLLTFIIFYDALYCTLTRTWLYAPRWWRTFNSKTESSVPCTVMTRIWSIYRYGKHNVFLIFVDCEIIWPTRIKTCKLINDT